MQKGHKISLTKEAGGSLKKIIMGVGWDAKMKKGFFGKATAQEIDLDASCVLLDAQKLVVDTIWFNQLKSKDGSIVHTGDNRTGEGEGDDEQIIIDLDAVPSNVASIVFVINSFTGESFSEIENAFCRIVNQTNNSELAKYDLSCQGNQTAMIMARVYRHNGEWKMTALGEACDGKTWKDLLPAVLRLV